MSKMQTVKLTADGDHRNSYGMGVRLTDAKTGEDLTVLQRHMSNAEFSLRGEQGVSELRLTFVCPVIEIVADVDTTIQDVVTRTLKIRVPMHDFTDPRPFPERVADALKAAWQERQAGE